MSTLTLDLYCPCWVVIISVNVCRFWTESVSIVSLCNFGYYTLGFQKIMVPIQLVCLQDQYPDFRRILTSIVVVFCFWTLQSPIKMSRVLKKMESSCLWSHCNLIYLWNQWISPLNWQHYRSGLSIACHRSFLFFGYFLYQ